MIAIDTNVLVYAMSEGEPKYQQARDALLRLGETGGPFGVPVFAVGEFLRVVTHPRSVGGPRSLDEATGFVDGALGIPGARLLLPGSRYWPLLGEVLRDGGATGNLVFDAQIAAVCMEHGADTVLTEDRDFRRFSGMRVRTLAEATA